MERFCQLQIGLHRLCKALHPEKDPGLSGRIVVGRVVVTTLRPGAERRSSVDPGGLLGRVVTLTFLPGFEPAEKGLGDDRQDVGFYR